MQDQPLRSGSTCRAMSSHRPKKLRWNWG